MINAKWFCQHFVVGIDEVAINETLFILLNLVFSDQAHGGIVEHDDIERNIVIHRGHDFHAAHLEAAIAEHSKGGFSVRELRTNGGGYGVA